MPFSRQILSKSTSVGVEPEAVGEDLAVVGQDLLGDAVALEGLGEEPADRPGVARTMMPAQTQKREWSSTPVRTLHSVPSSSSTPPTMSICHSSIGRPRSQRL